MYSAEAAGGGDLFPHMYHGVVINLWRRRSIENPLRTEPSHSSAWGLIFWKSQTNLLREVLFFENLVAKFWAACGAFWSFFTQYCQIWGRLRRFLINFDAILSNFGQPAALFGQFWRNIAKFRAACGAFLVKFLFFENLKPKLVSRFYFLKISNQSWSQGFIFW